MARFSQEEAEHRLVKQQAEIADLRARLARAEAALNDPLRVRERQSYLILEHMY
jgi:PAS domain S-box-containing protein